MTEHCCQSDAAEVQKQIITLYSDLATQPGKTFPWGKGWENACALGYSPAWLNRLPAPVWGSAAAVGNPFECGPIHAGETVVDLGCGAGADVCVAGLLVGGTGRLIGVDFTSAMVEKARANARLAGLTNVEIREADIAELPLPDVFTDVVISNGAINLSPRKPCVLKEALRVLKPGGRLYIADMVRDESVGGGATPVGPSSSSWANCVAGTLAPACFGQLMIESGFVDVEFLHTTGYRTAPETVGALFRARRPD